MTRFTFYSVTQYRKVITAARATPGWRGLPVGQAGDTRLKGTTHHYNFPNTTAVDHHDTPDLLPIAFSTGFGLTYTVYVLYFQGLNVTLTSPTMYTIVQVECKPMLSSQTYTTVKLNKS